MITVIIGQSGAGKTTFAKKNFLQGELKIINDVVPYTTNGENCALGQYGIDKRTEGTDTLPYNAGEKIRAQISKLHAAEKNILIEGDRINNTATFEFLKKLGAEVKIYLLSCTLETSIERLRAANSKITPKFIKATKTKSANNYKKWSKFFSGEIIIND